MRKQSFAACIALMLALCASFPFGIAMGATSYRGITMPTPWGWESNPIGDNPIFIARKLTNEALDATVVAHAREGRADDDAVIAKLLAEAYARPESPGWDKAVFKFKGGFALLCSGRDRTFAHAFLIVRDGRGASFMTFVGQWRDGHGLDIALDARKVLHNVKNR